MPKSPPDNETERVGLCVTCQHVRVVRSDKDSVFYRCQLAATDPRYPKYPRLPVRQCRGYERSE